MTTDPDLTELRAAIHNPGINPTYHAEQVARLRREWPTLYRAIHNLVGTPRRG